MKMSLAFQAPSVLDQEFATKSELHYGLRIPYERIAKAIREGRLAIHLIDNKLQINVQEALDVLFPPKPDLFA
jgi:hypothetical protein